jgi:hypothetical protein
MSNVEGTHGWKMPGLAWAALVAAVLLAGAAEASPVGGGPLTGPSQTGAPEPLTLGGIAVAGAGLAWARKRRHK